MLDSFLRLGSAGAQSAQNRADGSAEHEVRPAVGLGGGFVNQNQVSAPEILNQARRGIDDQGGSADDERVRFRDMADRRFKSRSSRDSS